MRKPLKITLFITLAMVVACTLTTTTLYLYCAAPRPKTVFLSPSTQTANVYADGCTTEGANMNAIADLVAALLPEGFTVIRNDPALTVVEAVEASNTLRPSVHVALHSNATGHESSTVRGCEIYVRRTDVRGHRIALAIYGRLAALTDIPGRGIKPSRTLLELTGTKAAAILVEIDFHDSVEGATWLTESREAIAEAIADGIVAYFEEPMGFGTFARAVLHVISSRLLPV